MTHNKKLNYRPYAQYDSDYARVPFIVRVSPAPDRVEFEWIDDFGGATEAEFHYRPADGGEYLRVRVEREFSVRVEQNRRYEGYLVTSDGRRSPLRRFVQADFHGTVINFLDKDDPVYRFSGQYLCSPSIVRLPDGTLLASMDVFGHGCAQDLTLLFYSEDDGKSWHYRTDLFPFYWGNLFCDGGAVYALGFHSEYGDLIVARSTDGGKTWDSTAVARGTSQGKNTDGCVKGLQRAPTKFLRANGRLWFQIEYGSWQTHLFANAVLSAPCGADLLDPDNWTMSPMLLPDREEAGSDPQVAGAIEGNMMLDREGQGICLTRYEHPHTMRVMRFDVNDPENPFTSLGFFPSPFGHTKFDLYDYSGAYYAIGNEYPGRNRLSLFKSRDLFDWQRVRSIVDRSDAPTGDVGYQYPYGIEENGTVYLAIRCADNGANSFHDSDAIVFRKVALED